MREIKFRGKKLDNGYGEWVYGDLIQKRIWDTKPNKFCIRTYDGGFDNTEECEIDPKTLGEYTGLHDKNGKEIYEGDIVKLNWLLSPKIGQVIFTQGMFCIVGDLAFIPLRQNGIDKPPKIEVIGNIYENPELLEGKDK